MPRDNHRKWSIYQEYRDRNHTPNVVAFKYHGIT